VVPMKDVVLPVGTKADDLSAWIHAVMAMIDIRMMVG